MRQLIDEIECFCNQTGMSDYTFGYKAIKNGRLVERLRDGRRIWPENEKKVRDFIHNYTPKNKRG